MKRIFDIFFTLISLLLFFPLLVTIAILIRSQLGAPILFKQYRSGRFGEPFEILKFRTMQNAIDEKGRLLPDSDRMVPIGNFLRKSSLDELPELWNVLKGDMSLVGPRPLLMEYLPLYNENQKKRHDLLPGITGWAQVNGRNAISWEEKFNLDVWYVENQSFWLDVRILLMTLKKVIMREGVSADNHATMPKFTGNAKQDNK